MKSVLDFPSVQVKPLKDLSFNSPNITATMTSRQFQIMVAVISNLLLARLPKYVHLVYSDHLFVNVYILCNDHLGFEVSFCVQKIKQLIGFRCFGADQERTDFIKKEEKKKRRMRWFQMGLKKWNWHA